MRTASKLLLAALAATALLALATAGASARNFSVTERNFEFVWNEGLGAPKTKFEIFDRIERVTACRVTFLGTFVERTIAKRLEAKIGEIKHAEREGCTAGTEAEFRNLPWEMRYRGFTGRLPNIETISIGVIGLETRTREGVFGIECVARTEALEPAIFILEGAGLANVRADEAATIRLGGVNLQCEANLSPQHFAGIGLVRNLPRTANITVTLI